MNHGRGLLGRAILGAALVVPASGPTAMAAGAVGAPAQYHPGPGGGGHSGGGNGDGPGRQWPGRGQGPERGGPERGWPERGGPDRGGPVWDGPDRPEPYRPSPPAPPAPSQGNDSSGDETSARCLPSAGACSVELSGPDTDFRVSAHSGDRSTQLRAAVDGGSRPMCPGYRPQGSDWVTFRFDTADSGATWAKTVSLTTHRALSESAAQELAERMQICFEAPYSFETRPGFGSAERGLGHDGVLPDCSGSGPCVSDRSVIQTAAGWVVRLTFRVPAGPADPKALG